MLDTIRSSGSSAPFLLTPLVFLSLVLSGAIFGFVYAWVCSTMWGLDSADPNVTISAMQAMNANVRNPVFAPAFFGTPLALIATALVCWMGKKRRAAIFFGSGSLLYVAGAMVPTITVNVSLNEALALVETPLDAGRAQAVWQGYSDPWQIWNTIRAVVSGFVLVLVGLGILSLSSCKESKNIEQP